MPSAKQFKDPWGWSKLEVYQVCPQQFKFKFIDKIKEEQGPALVRGSIIHNALEHYLNGWSSTLIEDINVKFWKKRLDVLKERQPFTEAAWGVNKKWEPLPSWFHEDTWLRAKSDFYYIDNGTLVLGDFKTGKYRVPSDDQILLYAIVGHAMNPEVSKVRTSFWFVDQAEAPHEELYTAKQLIDMREKFNQAVIPLYKDKKFAPKPGSGCRYCSFSRQKGGGCKY